VGKKLSEMTTKRVIVLVLVMLFTIPNLQANAHYTEMPSSAQYGADDVMSALINWWESASNSNNSNTNTAAGRTKFYRDLYEKSLLS
jgi:hypothetical protein